MLFYNRLIFHSSTINHLKISSNHFDHIIPLYSFKILHMYYFKTIIIFFFISPNKPCITSPGVPNILAACPMTLIIYFQLSNHKQTLNWTTSAPTSDVGNEIILFGIHINYNVFNI